MKRKTWIAALLILALLLVGLAVILQLRLHTRQEARTAPPAAEESSEAVPEPAGEAEPAQEPSPQPAPESAPAPAAEPAVTPSASAVAAPMPTPDPAPAPEPDPEPAPEARQIPVEVINRDILCPECSDGDYSTEREIFRGDRVIIRAEEEISALYIQWDRPPLPWSLYCGDRVKDQGQYGFVHEYVQLPKPSREVEMELSWEGDCGIAEVYAFSEGSRPDWVQVWQEPLADPELLVVVTHSDDEFVFLGGLVPMYVDRGRSVQMLYIVRHTGYRRHEMLDSLWTAGVTRYPLTTECADIYVNSARAAREVYGDSYVTGFLIEQLRRLRPQVVVGQAEDGDSGHPVHIFGVECLLAAVDSCRYAEEYPESAERYGTYTVPKVYLHLYGEPEDMVTLDYDRPLERFGGATAWEVAEAAFQRCVSQYEAGKYRVYGSDSVHDGSKFGLYHSVVGQDTEKNDLFEHLP